MILPSKLPRVEYWKAERQIQDGDLLSFHPRCRWYNPLGWFTWLIALTNKAHICHTAMAAWWDDELLAVQMTSVPTRIILLSDLVKQWPGKIVVSRPKHIFRKKIAVREMVKITEKPYGWLRLLLLGFAHTFTGGILYPNVPDAQPESTKWPPVCSESYSRAMRLAGFKPCPDRADCYTEPHHLYESSRFRPMFTLV